MRGFLRPYTKGFMLLLRKAKKYDTRHQLRANAFRIFMWWIDMYITKEKKGVQQIMKTISITKMVSAICFWEVSKISLSILVRDILERRMLCFLATLKMLM